MLGFFLFVVVGSGKDGYNHKLSELFVLVFIFFFFGEGVAIIILFVCYSSSADNQINWLTLDTRVQKTRVEV